MHGKALRPPPGTASTQRPAWVASLKTFLGTRQQATERCELCHGAIGAGHDHLIEPRTRRLLCACRACALLFTDREATRYRRIPQHAARLRGVDIADSSWEALLIPVNVAFLFRSSVERRIVALYPGPAGATESLLDLHAWEQLAGADASLQTLQEDVEALLVNRIDGAREYYRVPIDRCFALVGEIRSRWHGPGGGADVQTALAAFFQRLRRQTAGREGGADA